MSSRNLIVYNGTVYPSSTTADANAVQERDASGDTFAKGVNAATYTANAGAEYQTAVATYTANTTLGSTLRFVKGNATGGAITLTLPPAAASTGMLLTVIKIDSSGNVVTVKGTGAELINAANTYTGLSAQYYSVTLWCDGTQWWIV